MGGRYIGMDYYNFKLQIMSEQFVKSQLIAASELFANNQMVACRKVLSEIKSAHTSVEMNTVLCVYKESLLNPGLCLKKLMDILIAININVYKSRPQQQLNGKSKPNNQRNPRIGHELYFWNIVVLSQLLPNSEVTELVCNEALYYTDSMRTETSLMILYQMLKIMESSGRLASCIALIEKQNGLVSRASKLKREDHCYRFLNQILFNRVLLKLGMIDGSRMMYQMRFSGIIENKEGVEIKEIGGVPIVVYRELLSAEIEYHSKNYEGSVKILGDLVPLAEGLTKNRELVRKIIDHNLSLVLVKFNQGAAAQVLLTKSLAFFTGSKEMDLSNERSRFVTICKDNMLLSALMSASPCYSLIAESLKSYEHSYSYKMNYRKAQVCINFYHELLRSPGRVLTYKQLHDFYDTVYYYPNQPYFQQKGKNKNVNFTNGKYSYRRFVMPEWEMSFENGQHGNGEREKENSKIQNSLVRDEKELKKGASKQKKSVSVKQGKKQQPIQKEENSKATLPPLQNENRSKLRAILELAESFLKQALIILEKQKKTIVNFEGEEKGLTEQVNEKLYSEYIDFKSSIYAQLCYVNLCLHEWAKTIHFVSEYQSFEKMYQLQSKNPVQQKIYYNIMSYKVEALCEVNRTMNAYETIHEFIGCIDYSQTALTARSTANQNPGQTYFEQMSQYNNFCFNLSVLHSRDNKIPEAFQSIQKILQQMRLSPSNPQANLPLSIIELLIHYNLRTGNNQSALQMIKRRRILNLPGVLGHYQPTLAVTK